MSHLEDNSQKFMENSTRNDCNLTEQDLWGQIGFRNATNAWLITYKKHCNTRSKLLSIIKSHSICNIWLIFDVPNNSAKQLSFTYKTYY